MSYSAPFWATLHPISLRCTLELYAAYCWAFSCTLLSYSAINLLTFTASFFEQSCTLWATLHPLSYAAPHSAVLHSHELYQTLISYTAPAAELCCTLLSNPPHTLYLAELCCTLLNYAAPSKQWCTLLSYAAPYAVATQLRWTLLSYAASYWATLHPTEHHGTEPVALSSKPMLSYVNLQQKGWRFGGV
jgi:hypothetical protein